MDADVRESLKSVAVIALAGLACGAAILLWPVPYGVPEGIDAQPGTVLALPAYDSTLLAELDE